MKIVINDCYGGFSVSHDALIEIYKRKGIKLYAYKTVSREWFHLSDDQARKECCPLYRSVKLPTEATEHLENTYVSTSGLDRNDPDLVAVVKKMGKKAWGMFAKLKVVDIPDDVQWEIKEYDGIEHVAEKHRTWC